VNSSSSFWRGKRVLLTGHTGFKGAWMALWLSRAGASVTGFSLPPAATPNLFELLSPWPELRSILGDLRDVEAVRRAVGAADPEIIIHMAAQALVLRSFREPVETFATNVMGTAHLLAAAAGRPACRAILVVTSDKVYDNRETGRAFGEEDALGGDDPYSASKAATEMVARSWRSSFFADGPALGIARGGNVIGGGDFAEDRLVPDILRAGEEGLPVTLRYPDSIRPWQHVLDVVVGYESYARQLATGPAPRALNFGPAPDAPVLTVHEIVESLQHHFGWTAGWHRTGDTPLPEKKRLALDPAHAKAALGWQARLDTPDALAWIARWHRVFLDGGDVRAATLAQIAEHESLGAQ
jgi:CDP-glucose 4,6-dehydratase